jgi:hypothetical protein
VSVDRGNVARLPRVSATGGNVEPPPKVGGTGGGDGGMDDMLKRLHTVEQTVSEIRADVGGLTAVMPHLATKADVSNSALRIIGWMIGTAIALTTLAFTIARYVAPAGGP